MTTQTAASPLTERQQQFLDAIRAGHATRPDLARHLGCSLPAAHDMIERLVEKGAITCTGRLINRQGQPRAYKIVEPSTTVW